MASESCVRELIQETLTQRVFPMETVVSRNDAKLTNVQAKIETRDAEILNIEKRVEELIKEVEALKDKPGNPFTDVEGGDSNRSRGLLSSPAFRNMDHYSGDHAKFARWRSKLKGLLRSENDGYVNMLKLMESPVQGEIPAMSEGKFEYQKNVDKFAGLLDMDPGTLRWMSR